MRTSIGVFLAQLQVFVPEKARCNRVESLKFLKRSSLRNYVEKELWRLAYPFVELNLVSHLRLVHILNSKG